MDCVQPLWLSAGLVNPSTKGAPQAAIPFLTEFTISSCKKETPPLFGLDGGELAHVQALGN